MGRLTSPPSIPWHIALLRAEARVHTAGCNRIAELAHASRGRIPKRACGMRIGRNCDPLGKWSGFALRKSRHRPCLSWVRIDRIAMVEPFPFYPRERCRHPVGFNRLLISVCQIDVPRTLMDVLRAIGASSDAITVRSCNSLAPLNFGSTIRVGFACSQWRKQTRRRRKSFWSENIHR